MTLEQIKSIFSDAMTYCENPGDLSFIEDLLIDNMKVFHIDSYNIQDDRAIRPVKRFQGVFYWQWKDGRTAIADECPLAILKKCTHYQIRVNEGHLVWTIWFD